MRTELQTVLNGLREIPADELPALIGDLETLKAAAWARLTTTAPAPQSHDEQLSIEAAAERLGVSKDYLYRHHASLPFTRHMGRRLLFSSSGIDKYIAQQGRFTPGRR